MELIDALIERARSAGFNNPDVQLLLASIGVILGLFLLGIAGNARKRRWTARAGWIVLTVSIAVLMYTIGLGKPSVPA